MEATDLGLPGLKLITLDQRRDSPSRNDRGTFTVAWLKDGLAQHGLETPDWRQVNFVNNYRGALRAFHGEPWGKYVFVVSGVAQCAWVDLRPESLNLGRCVSLTLGGSHAVYVPPGYGNGYLACTEGMVYIYMTTREWRPGDYTNVRWNDPDIFDVVSGNPFKWDHTGMPYRIKQEDREAPFLREVFPDHPRFAKR